VSHVALGLVAKLIGEAAQVHGITKQLDGSELHIHATDEFPGLVRCDAPALGQPFKVAPLGPVENLLVLGKVGGYASPRR